MNSIRRAGILAVVAAAPGIFAAQGLAASPGPYVDAELGHASIGLASVPVGEFEESGIDNLKRDRRGVGYAFAAGWRFSPYLALQAAWIDLGEGGYSFTAEDEEEGITIDAKIGARSRGPQLQ